MIITTTSTDVKNTRLTRIYIFILGVINTFYTICKKCANKQKPIHTLISRYDENDVNDVNSLLKFFVKAMSTVCQWVAIGQNEEI